MSVDPQEVIERAEEARERSRLNAWVAVTVALLATFMGICKVKDDNIVQAMQQAQADKVDYWGYYQARNTQLKVFEQSAVQAALLAEMSQGPAREAALAQAAAAKKEAARMSDDKNDQKAKAEAAGANYKRLNKFDDQFDLADAGLAVAIALLALTSLTQKNWLFVVAMVPTFFGLLMGLAGLFGWGIHPDALARWLS